MKKLFYLISLLAVCFYSCKKSNMHPKQAAPLINIVGTWTEWENIAESDAPNSSYLTNPYTNEFTQRYQFLSDGGVYKTEIENIDTSVSYTEYAGTYTIVNTGSQFDSLRIKKTTDNGIWELFFNNSTQTSAIINQQGLTPVSETWAYQIIKVDTSDVAGTKIIDSAFSLSLRRLGSYVKNGKSYPTVFVEDYKRPVKQ